MPKFIHIDIMADDPERVVSFFNEVFGRKVSKLEGPVPYWLLNPDVGNPNAVGAGISKREQPWQSVTPTIDVRSIDDFSARIDAAGGTIVAPKAAIPGVGVLVTFKDPGGNIFSILEPASSDASPPELAQRTDPQVITSAPGNP